MLPVEEMRIASGQFSNSCTTLQFTIIAGFISLFQGYFSYSYRIQSCTGHFAGLGCNSCTNYYYGGSCDVYCKATSEYTCDSNGKWTDLNHYYTVLTSDMTHKEGGVNVHAAWLRHQIEGGEPIKKGTNSWKMLTILYIWHNFIHNKILYTAQYVVQILYLSVSISV